VSLHITDIFIWSCLFRI